MGHLPPELELEPPPVGEAGQPVVVGVMAKLLLERLALGDLREQALEDRARRAVRRSVGDDRLVAHPEHLPVASDHAVLDAESVAALLASLLLGLDAIAVPRVD